MGVCPDYTSAVRIRKVKDLEGLAVLAYNPATVGVVLLSSVSP